MKFLTLLAILVVVFVASSSAQRRCPQRARPPRCVGDRNVGSTCATAPPRRMWYYNATNRTCIAMDYLGCGGNSNRWCSRRICTIICRRRPPPTPPTPPTEPTPPTPPTTT